MQAYTNEPAVNKSSEPFALLPYQPRRRKVLAQSVSLALASIKVWTWSLGARLGRTWRRNPNHDQGQHSKERGERERQLARDVDRLAQTRNFEVCRELCYRYRCSYEAVLSEVQRLTAGGDWWKPRSYVDPATGEMKQTLYLPEDTWAAQHALAWCVAFLDRLLASVPFMTERVTHGYRAENTNNRFRGYGRPVSVADAMAFVAEVARRRTGAQPELPATS